MITAAMQSQNEVNIDLATLREELNELKHEIQVIKTALKNKIARYEIDQVKKGREMESILRSRF